MTTEKTEKELLKEKIIGFQKQIAELKLGIAQKTFESKEREKAIFSGFFEIADALENLQNNLEARKDELDRRGKKLSKNIKSIHKKLIRQLGLYSIVPISFPDNKAEMETCKIIETQKRPELENETIVEIIKNGYINEQDGLIMRKAEVVTVLNSDDREE